MIPIAVKKVRSALNFSVKLSPNTVKSYIVHDPSTYITSKG
ncbi:hypothetical protein PT2222_140339 [Paraburkholderia tropica]